MSYTMSDLRERFAPPPELEPLKGATFRVPIRLFDAVGDLAKARGWTRSEVMRQALTRYLEEEATAAD